MAEGIEKAMDGLKSDLGASMAALGAETEDIAGKDKETAAQSLDMDALAMRLRRETVIRKVVDSRKVEKAQLLIDQLPGKEETLHCLMGGDFNAWDLIPAILNITGKPASRLIIATLGFNRGNMTHLGKLIDEGKVEKAALLCSHYFQSTDPGAWDVGKEILEDRGMNIAFCRNHAKIICIEAGQPYVVEGSANLRSCNNLEQFTLTNSRPLFEFHAGWIQEITGC